MENTIHIMKDQELVDQLQIAKKIQKDMKHSLDLYDTRITQDKKRHKFPKIIFPAPPLHFGGVFV
jgi:hypothetical protein